MNTKTPGFGYLLATGGLGWDTGKWKMYLIDMTKAGPVPGSRILKDNNATNLGGDVASTEVNNNGTILISNTALSTPWTAPTYKCRLQTLAAHGLTSGTRFALFQRTYDTSGLVISTNFYVPTYVRTNGTQHFYNEYVRAGSNGGSSTLRHRCIYAGDADGTEQTWGSTKDVITKQVGNSQNSIWIAEKFPYTYSPINNNWTISDVYADNSFGFTVPFNGEKVGGYLAGFIQPLNFLTLSQIGPEDCYWAVSDAITSKSYGTNPAGAFDQPDQTLVSNPANFILPPTGAGHMAVLVKVGPDLNGADLSYEEQVVVAMWDYRGSGAPFPITPSAANSFGDFAMNFSGGIRV